jgi:hypothetical protein
VPSDLLGLEQYARERAGIRARMITHRAARRLVIGPNCNWSFEDRATIAYQVQEMLRAERIFEPAGVADEDLERESGEKTSAVHFLRFELDEAMVQSLRAGAALSAGVSHAAYLHEVAPVPPGLRAALLADFD